MLRLGLRLGLRLRLGSGLELGLELVLGLTLGSQSQSKMRGFRIHGNENVFFFFFGMNGDRRKSI